MPTPREGTPAISDRDYTVHLTPEDREKLRQSLVDKDYGTFEMWLQRGMRSLQGKEAAEFLAEASIIADLAGESRLALKYALEAAAKAPEDDAIRALVKKLGGNAAVLELSSSLPKQEASKPEAAIEANVDQKKELEFVNKEYSRITDELVALDAHDWKEKTGLTFTNPEERTKALEALREELQKKVYRRNELRDALKLNVAPTT